MASERSFKILDIYSDEGKSSETLDRPALTRLLAAIDAGEVKRLIVYSIDRMTRRLYDLQELLERLSRNDIQLIVVTDQMFSHAAASRLMTNIVSAASEFQLELTRDRMADARAALKHHGKRVAGRVPFGYRPDKASRTLIPHSDQAPIVRELFELASQGTKPSELAIHANSNGCRNHRNETGRWTPRWIIKLLMNRVYVGEIKHGTSWLPGDLLPIVSRAMFDAAQDQLAKRRARGKPRTKGALSKTSISKLQLTGILYCGQCNRAMSSSVSFRGQIRYRYYRCRSHAGGRAPCPGVNIAAFEAERLVNDVLVEIEDKERCSAKFSTYWRGLSHNQRKEQLGGVVERILFDHKAQELTVQFKDGIDSIVERLSSEVPGEG